MKSAGRFQGVRSRKNCCVRMAGRFSVKLVPSKAGLLVTGFQVDAATESADSKIQPVASKGQVKVTCCEAARAILRAGRKATGVKVNSNGPLSE